MRIYKLKVYHIGSCDVDIFLVMASSKSEAVEKLKSKGLYPGGGVEELYWDDGVHLLRNY